MKFLPLLLLLPSLPQDAWWDADWGARRAVTVVNYYEDGPLPAGFQVRMPVNVNFMEMTVRKDLADLMVTYDGKLIPTFAEESGDKVHVWFRVQKDIPAGKRDGKYHLYYANSGAKRKASQVFDFHADFETGIPKSLDIDAEVETGTEDGTLVVTDIPTHRANQAPARILLKELPKLTAFALRISLTLIAP